MVETVDHLTCRACQGRVREFEPDIALLKFDGSEKHFYHTWCEEAAQRIMSEEPDAWSLTRRHLFWEEGV